MLDSARVDRAGWKTRAWPAEDIAPFRAGLLCSVQGSGMQMGLVASVCASATQVSAGCSSNITGAVLNSTIVASGVFHGARRQMSLYHVDFQHAKFPCRM